MPSPLDNIFWNCLAGPQAHFASGGEHGRRYMAGFSPIAAFPDSAHPDFDAIAPYFAPGEQFYIEGWTGDAPPGWRVEVDGSMFCMLWQGGTPETDAAPDAQPLAARHAEQALALATLTRPGPFGIRTIELGEYFGYFDGEQLIAMAGERSAVPGYREISGVCTHPDHQGQGLAKKLMLKLIRRQMLRGEVPYLHVMSSNETALALYRRMGFADYRLCPVRVVTRL
jgi:ribosomal protein S18 acetylase RimI-like enzyme